MAFPSFQVGIPAQPVPVRRQLQGLGDQRPDLGEGQVRVLGGDRARLLRAGLSAGLDFPPCFAVSEAGWPALL